MLADAPFIGFIPVRDLTAARAFFAGTLGLPVMDESPFALVLNWTAPSGDRVAWFADPDGNTLSLTEFGPA